MSVSAWIEAALKAQGIELADGRAGKIAPGIEALLAAAAGDRLLAALEFDALPTPPARLREGA